MRGRESDFTREEYYTEGQVIATDEELLDAMKYRFVIDVTLLGQFDYADEIKGFNEHVVKVGERIYMRSEVTLDIAFLDYDWEERNKCNELIDLLCDKTFPKEVQNRLQRLLNAWLTNGVKPSTEWVVESAKALWELEQLEEFDRKAEVIERGKDVLKRMVD